MEPETVFRKRNWLNKSKIYSEKFIWLDSDLSTSWNWARFTSVRATNHGLSSEFVHESDGPSVRSSMRLVVGVQIRICCQHWCLDRPRTAVFVRGGLFCMIPIFDEHMWTDVYTVNERKIRSNSILHVYWYRLLWLSNHIWLFQHSLKVSKIFIQKFILEIFVSDNSKRQKNNPMSTVVYIWTENGPNLSLFSFAISKLKDSSAESRFHRNQIEGSNQLGEANFSQNRSFLTLFCSIFGQKWSFFINKHNFDRK